MKQLLIVVAVMLLSVGAAHAGNDRTVYMKVTNSKGVLISTIELSNEDFFKGPVIDRVHGTVKLKKKVYKYSDIGEIRFTYGKKSGTITGIDEVIADNEKVNAKREGVYNLQGVRVADEINSSLPKGVYIVDGRKVVVK